MAKIELKMPKLPKSLGACVDLYYDLRQERLTYSKGVDERKAKETFVSEHIINNVPKGDAGAVGKRFKGIVRTDDQFQAEEWDKLYAYIRKEGAFDILNRALNQAAIEDRTNALNVKIDAFNAKLPANSKDRKPRKMLPGIKVFKAVKLSVTKL